MLSAARVRALVSRFRGCLAALPLKEEQVLILRSGVGLRRGYDDPAVARILGMSVPREQQTELLAVGQLTATASEASCRLWESWRSALAVVTARLSVLSSLMAGPAAITQTPLTFVSTVISPAPSRGAVAAAPPVPATSFGLAGPPTGRAAQGSGSSKHQGVPNPPAAIRALPGGVLGSVIPLWLAIAGGAAIAVGISLGLGWMLHLARAGRP